MKLEDVARQWMEKAGHDLVNAKHVLTLVDDCPYDTVCFHAQQAVEKCVKAVLVKCGIRFGKVHDVGALLEQLPETKRPLISIQEQVQLSNYAVTARYPGVHEEPTRQDAAEALHIAERVKKWALEQLSGTDA